MKAYKMLRFCSERSVMRYSLFILFTLLVTGCSILQPTVENQVVVSYTQPDRITFEGKGAGAAFALMATMGPVGAALGVAIDEGIAKDIRETAEQGDVNFKAMLSDQLSRHRFSSESGLPVSRVEVEKYGFKIVDASSETVAANIELTLVSSDDSYGEEAEVIQTLKFPADYESDVVNEVSYTLLDVKTRPEAVRALFQHALEVMLPED